MDGRLIKGSLALVLAVVAAVGPWCRPAMAQLSPEEAMRLHEEVASISSELEQAEERWLELQEDVGAE